MLKLKKDQSYAWLFAIFAILFLGGFALCEAFGHGLWGSITMPAFVAFLLLAEIKSGVAFDSLWRASYSKGSWQYQAVLAWHAVGVISLSIFAYLFIK